MTCLDQICLALWRMVRSRAGLLVLFANLILVAPTAAVSAQQAAAPPADKLAELTKLLDDPSIRAWILAQSKADGTAAAKPKATEPVSGVQAWEQRIRSNLHGLLTALPTIPREFSAAATRIRAETMDKGFLPSASIFSAVLIACLIAEWAARRKLRRALLHGNPLLSRTYLELVPLAVFSLVAVAAFFSFEWPPLLHATILFYLVAAIAFRVVAAIAAMAASAGSLSPFLFRRTLLFSGILLFALASTALSGVLSIPSDSGHAALFLVTLLLLAICCEAVWREPNATAKSLRTKFLQTLYFLVLWAIWTLGFRVLFWLGIYAVVLPRILPSIDRVTKAFAATRWPDNPDSNIPTVLVVRGVRSAILAAAVVWLSIVWQFNPRSLGHENSWLSLIILGVIKGVVVILIADLGWSLAKALINRKLASVAGDAPLHAEEAARRARLRTLLPIFRNGLAALILAIAGLTVLAEVGVEIGPLVAGAGIFGVAIGFGAQTLVKDVISGVFFLMDDAFRVGEYIQSGSYKGTVESFSLRSIRLRHHRGPVFTVPFGELGAVQNLSRDWAIDKFLLRVNFDSDVAKAKKLVKAIGAELLADQELGPVIIETLKMKGVEQIGEFGIELAFAFTAVPGWQSVIRRRAYMMIREAFKQNGIGFSQPTVRVGGHDEADVTAAAHSMALQKAQAAIDQQNEG